MQVRNNIVLWQTFHKFIHKFTQSVSGSTVVLIITPYFCWRLLLSFNELIKEIWNELHPFSIFVSLALKHTHTHTANRRQERYRNDRKLARRYSGTENQADAIVTLWVYIVINLTVTAGDCWHIRTMSDFNKQKVNDTDIDRKNSEYQPIPILIRYQHRFV